MNLSNMCLAAGVAGGLFLLTGCGAAKAPPQKSPPLSVAVAEVGAPSGVNAMSATGALKRRREVVLSFRVPGVIQSLAVDDGDVVRKGQVLAALDPTTVESRVRQTRADLDRARADLGRLTGLVERGAISRQQLDAQRNAVADAEAVYQSAAFDRRWAQIVAPAAGVVLVRSAQAGEVVQPGQAVLSIADETSPLVLRAPVADKDAVRLHLGQPAVVSVDALPGQRLEGRVSRIGQQAGVSSGQIQVEVTIQARPELRSGLIAHAELAPTRSVTTGFVRVPAEAVLEARGERAFVMRFDSAAGVARRTDVRFGGFDGDDALVEGLPTGARVITAGAGYVGDGQRVRVVQAVQSDHGARR